MISIWAARPRPRPPDSAGSAAPKPPSRPSARMKSPGYLPWSMASAWGARASRIRASMPSPWGAGSRSVDMRPPGSGVGLQFRIDGGAGQVVGVVAQRGQADTQHHIQRLGIAVTRRAQFIQRFVGYLTAMFQHLQGELRQSIELGVG